MATVYPFDPTGTSAANRIPNEQHVITAQNFRDYHYVIPKFAPFFEDNIVIKLQYPNGTSRNLTRGIDYYFSNQFLDASRACAKPLFGSISFLDTDTAGILSITYNTVGGMWNITVAEMTRILAEEMRNPRTTTWEQITNLPQRFPVIDHEWDLIDMVGASALAKSLDDVRDAVLSANGGGISGHTGDKNNPHSTTKAQVGLGDVSNFPIATQALAQEGASNASYMTPLRTADAIATIGGALLRTHSNNTNNPHQVNKDHVGLSRLQNYDIATDVQAESGVTNTAYMTPLRTAQAIATQVGTSYKAHAADKNNPHNVTKDQIGLFNLENFAVASQEEARAGIANDRYMTPRRTTQLVQELVMVQLDGHALRLDNPHAVTATQVGAYSVSQTDGLLANYIRYNDPWVGGMSKDAFVAEVLTGTAANANRVDNKTVTQILNEGTSIYDTLYARSSHAFSRDKSLTLDPVALPYRWINVGFINILSSVETGSSSSITATYPDVYWFLTGGHKQEATSTDNAKSSSPCYLVHAKNGIAANAHSFDVTRLNGSVDSDVKFGYTFSEATSTMTVWVRVAHGYNDLSVTRLTTLGNAQQLTGVSVIEEPAGITYTTPVSYATNAELDAANETFSSFATTVNTFATNTNIKMETIDSSLESIVNRLTIIETELGIGQPEPTPGAG